MNDTNIRERRYLFLVLLFTSVILLFISLIPVSFFMDLANRFAVEGVCNACSEQSFIIFKVFLFLVGCIFLVLLFFIKGVYDFVSSLSFDLFNFKFFILIFFIGFFLRIHNLGYHSLFVDEALVANSILEPTIKNMIYFKDTQLSPFLFLIATRFIINTFGESEFVFRLLPFIFGTLSIPLIYIISQKITKNKIISLISSSLFAFNLVILRYSQELKPYMGDIFFVLLLFCLTEKFVEKFDFKYFIILTVCTILGLGISYPLIFIIPAINIRIFLAYINQENLKISFNNLLRIKDKILSILVYDILILFEFFIIYSFITKHYIKQNLLVAWTGFFVEDYSIIHVLFFLIKQTYSFFPYLFKVPLLMLVLFLFGFVLILIKKKYFSSRVYLLYFLVPIPFVIIANLIKKYPYGGVRADLFLVPFIFIIIAIGIYQMIYNIKINKMFKIIIIFFLITFPAIFASSLHFIIPRQNEEMRGVVEYYSYNVLPNDITYVHCGDIAFKYYYKDTENVIFRDPLEPKTSTNKIRDIIPYASKKRLWLIFSHCENNKEEALRFTSQHCNLMSSFEDIGSSAYLFLC